MPYDVHVDRAEDSDVTLPLDASALAAFAGEVLAGERVEDGTGLTVLFGDDTLLQRLNRDHRGIDEPTDVLSFAAEEGEAFPGQAGEPRYLGDIVISAPWAARQAAEAGRDLELEVRHLVLHGIYHLLGYDHETPEEEADLKRREEAILGPDIHDEGAGGVHEHA